MTLRLALSPGEPGGIGPDLAVIAAQKRRDCELVAFADADLLRERARTLGLPLKLEPYEPDAAPAAHVPGTLGIAHVPLATTAVAGRTDPRNAHGVLAALDAAHAACARGDCAALVTAPVHKAAINDAGIAFTGHTEYLARLDGVATPVMLLVAGDLRVALATTHLPLAEVPRAITAERLDRCIAVLGAGLERDFGLVRPRLLVLGLNPHAGEGGHLGGEDAGTVTPAVVRARARGLAAEGPVPADTAFVPARLAETDAVLAMYHDQGLPVLKHAGFGRAVNVTLGLAIVRTSVDHGTALDLAGTGRVDPGSLEAALALAGGIAARRRGG